MLTVSVYPKIICVPIVVIADYRDQEGVDTSSLIPYSGNFLRTKNFAVFVDFTATSKINP